MIESIALALGLIVLGSLAAMFVLMVCFMYKEVFDR